MKEYCRETGKIKHSTEADAIKSTLLRTSNKPVFLRAYKCPFCFYWHLTSKSK